MGIRYAELNFKTPLIFADGTTFFKNIAKDYKPHKKGFFIMGPSGSGKTHFIKSNAGKDWIDGDILWEKANAHPKEEWWLLSGEVMDEVDMRSDFITQEAKKLGFWVVGASCYWLKPDAIVLPHWSTHKKYIRNREKINYDGGATTEDFTQVLRHRKWIRKWKKKGVPEFRSVSEAAAYLAKNL